MSSKKKWMGHVCSTCCFGEHPSSLVSRQATYAARKYIKISPGAAKFKSRSRKKTLVGKLVPYDVPLSPRTCKPWALSDTCKTAASILQNMWKSRPRNLSSTLLSGGNEICQSCDLGITKVKLFSNMRLSVGLDYLGCNEEKEDQLAK